MDSNSCWQQHYQGSNTQLILRLLQCLTFRAAFVLICPGKLETAVCLSLVRTLEELAAWVGCSVGGQGQALQAMIWTQGRASTAPPAVAIAASVAGAACSAWSAVPADPASMAIPLVLQLAQPCSVCQS